MKYVPKLKHWFCGILVIVISLVFCQSGHYCLYRDCWGAIFLYGLLTPFILTYIKEQPFVCASGNKLISGFIAALFAIFITIGKNYYYRYNWYHCFGTGKSIILLILQFLIYTYILFYIIIWLFGKIETYSFDNSKKFFDYRKCLFLILLTRGLFFLAFFPCLFDFDAALGMRTFLDPNSAICNHHPVFVESIHAFFFTLGSLFGSPTIGFALLSLLFIIFSSVIILYGIKLVYRTTINNSLCKKIAYIFAFFPIFPYVSLLPTKDGFFAYAFLFYELTLFELYQSECRCIKQKRFLLFYSIALCLVCLTRHQGFVIVILSTLVLLLTFRKYSVKLLLLSTPTVFLIMIVTNFFYPLWNIEPGGKQELYGTLFQQTACYLSLHPKDITYKEKNAIINILDEDVIMNNYESYITDPIKNEYKYNPRFSDMPQGLRRFRHIDHTEEKKQLNEYLSAWFSMGKRHPLSYIQATITLFWGFVYNANYPLLNIYTEGFYNPKANTSKYQYWRIDYMSRLVNEYQPQLMQIPILNCFLSIPYYIWSAIFLILMLIYHRNIKLLAVFFPLILSIGVLLICPVVNGRYVFPIVCCLPILFVAVLDSSKKRKNL